jgi:hypothetical protein
MKRKSLGKGRVQVTITESDIIGLLKSKGYKGSVSDISVHVPGGGDWSNCELNLSEVGGITVTMKKEVG